MNTAAGNSAMSDNGPVRPPENLDDEPLVGILGGMGPAATVDFYDKLVRRTPAATDQDHLRVVIWADPTIPDRIGAILGHGPDPYPAMLAGAERLAALGATVVAVPCHSAHFFLERLAHDTGLRFVNMVQQTVRALVDSQDSVRVAGLLGTRATLHSGLYQSPLTAAGISSVLPTDADQHDVDTAIRLVKFGDAASARELVENAIRSLMQRGADAVILGCTELPIAMGGSMVNDLGAVLDPTDLLAQAVVRTCTRSG